MLNANNITNIVSRKTVEVETLYIIKSLFYNCLSNNYNNNFIITLFANKKMCKYALRLI